MATAKIRVKTDYGWSEELYALIDQGSMPTFISENAVQKLKLKKEKNNKTVSGIGGVKTEKSSGSVKLEFTVRHETSFRGKTTAIIMRKLTTLAPVSQIKEKITHQKEFSGLKLADSFAYDSFKVDINYKE